MKEPKQKNPIISNFVKIQRYLVSRIVWPYSFEQDSLIRWRAVILTSILIAGLLFGIFALIAAAVLIVRENAWGLAFVDISGLILCLSFLFVHRIRFEIRASITLLMFYVIGVAVVLTVGPLSGGPAWLFAFAVLAGVLIGNYAAFVAILMNAIFLSTIGIMISTGKFGNGFPFFNSTQAMIAAGVNFIVLNAVTAVSVSALVKGLFHIYSKKEELANSLKAEQLQLIEIKQALELEIQDRKQAEEEKIQLEEQYRQAQRMESIGRLAGGVAHDYNNALTAIMGFTELAMMGADPAGPLHADLNQVLKAGRRAQDITRQLLAFARKQTIAPRVLDLNQTVESMLKMLRRLIGEDIDLVWLPGTNLWPVKMDPSQIDQILANLCVNARDAIIDVGKITIETGTKVFDTAYCADHVGFIPGEFALLALSDNGCGMDKEILDKIFEPFFTTKDVDKGTGLGLATVYGIVKQNNGFINVYSEPGKGTTIKIYLPRYEGKPVEIQGENTEKIPQGHGETILVVEDDLPILELAQKILEGLNYTVLIADTPKGAMGLVEEHTGKIHLLITDVIMPEMNGRELSEQLKSLSPDLKCIFMSGYTSNTIAHHGVLDEGVHFVQKPFSKRDLATIIRKVLDKND